MFKKNYLSLFLSEFSQDDNWLSWFIGFAEGDGALLEHKGRSFFVLTQKDGKVLNEISNTLNFGLVKSFSDNKGNLKYSRYIVSDNKSIYLLYLLFNGNVVLQSRINQLKKWNFALANASRFNLSLFYTQNIPILQTECRKPSLNDGWLSGFTDAEGCFSIKIPNEKYYVSALYILDQKDEDPALPSQKSLNTISNLFSEKLKAKLFFRTPKPSLKGSESLTKNNTKTSISNVFRLSVSCNHPLISNKIINYFSTFKLKTSKANSFEIWCKILDIILGNQPLEAEEIFLIRKLRKNMNFYTIENKSTGKANKS